MEEHLIPTSPLVARLPPLWIRAKDGRPRGALPLPLPPFRQEHPSRRFPAQRSEQIPLQQFPHANLQQFCDSLLPQKTYGIKSLGRQDLVADGASLSQ